MADNPTSAAIDANVILRQIMKDDPDLYPKAVRLIRAVQDGVISGVLDPVSLAEVVWVMQSFYKVPRVEISETLSDFVKSPNIQMADKRLYLRALELYGSTLNSFGDACCCAAAAAMAGGNLLSFDRDLSKVDGITRWEDVG